MKQIRLAFLLLTGFVVSSCIKSFAEATNAIINSILVPLASPFNSRIPESEGSSQLGFYYGDTMYANNSERDHYVRAIHDTDHNETWISAPNLISNKDAQTYAVSSLTWRLILKYKDGISEAEVMSIRREPNESIPNAYYTRMRKHKVTSCQVEFDSIMEDHANSKGKYVGKYFSGDFNLTFIDADTGEERSFTGGRFRVVTNKVGENMIAKHEDDDFFHFN